MVVQTKPLADVTHTAIRVLCKEIGLVDTIRFVGQFTLGHGDYAAERDQIFADMTLDQIISEIKLRYQEDDKATSHAKAACLPRGERSEGVRK